ncbi:hypothetical protein DID88_008026 [Monilinia fructigena]|uniref:Uncharacterized protein n=1 Tax=Monilinia fructigena TaxID=38457 RepID=A0A395J4I8_9HELO|nr:hypothetical protein DID88_008026 [Monilinia fructigena]
MQVPQSALQKKAEAERKQKEQEQYREQQEQLRQQQQQQQEGGTNIDTITTRALHSMLSNLKILNLSAEGVDYVDDSQIYDNDHKGSESGHDQNRPPSRTAQNNSENGYNDQNTMIMGEKQPQNQAAEDNEMCVWVVSCGFSLTAWDSSNPFLCYKLLHLPREVYAIVYMYNISPCFQASRG